MYKMHEREDDICSFCGNGLIEFVSSDGITSVDHLACNMCCSTFPIRENRLDRELIKAGLVVSLPQARRYIISGIVQINGLIIYNPDATVKKGDSFTIFKKTHEVS